MLACLSSAGGVFLQFLSGSNTEVTVGAFFIKLEEALSEKDPDWREKSVLILDNCPSHKTLLVRRVLAHLRFPVLYSAPASYTVLPIE